MPLREVAGSSLGVTESSLGTTDHCHAEWRLTVMDAGGERAGPRLIRDRRSRATAGLEGNFLRGRILAIDDGLNASWTRSAWRSRTASTSSTARCRRRVAGAQWVPPGRQSAR